jgi:CNT family concentrative nucleoside transporter
MEFIMLNYFVQHNRYMSIIGALGIIALATLCSSNKKKINWRTIINGLFIHILLAFFILKTSLGKTLFEAIASGFSQLYAFAGAGTRFVFGNLADTQGPWLFVFAVQVIPIIIFFGALMSLLYHLRIIQLVVKLCSFAIRPILGTSGAETLCAVANSMLGQTEAPLLVRKYIDHMTKSEILVVMVSGFATLSGSLLAVYGALGISTLHLLSASIMSIPSSILIAKLLLPEEEVPQTSVKNTIELDVETKNSLDAIAQGTSDGMMLAVNVMAMLISFISLIAMLNFILLYCGAPSLNDIFSTIFAPCALLLGIPSYDIKAAGMLLGQKLVINEFVAYTNMVATSLSERSHIILTYALCGFANFSCIGIQIGGIGALAPKKRTLLTQLGFKALLGGTLANLLNAAIAALFI